MFRKRRVIINGVDLPEEFAGASIINNVAISPDGAKYAYVSKSGGVITGEMPKDGKLKIDGTEIHYQRGNVTAHRGFHVGGFGGSVHIDLGGISVVSIGGNSFSIGNDLEYEIDKGYDGISSVALRKSARNINLGLSNDGKTYVRGFTRREPDNRSGHLSVDGLEGVLELPKSREDLVIDVKISAGDVEGEVAHKGQIETSAGDIRLRVYSPLTIEAHTSAGDVSVRKMISEGRGVYTPPNATPIGRLSVRTSAGDINVAYEGR